MNNNNPLISYYIFKLDCIRVTIPTFSYRKKYTQLKNLLYKCVNIAESQKIINYKQSCQLKELLLYYINFCIDDTSINSEKNKKKIEATQQIINIFREKSHLSYIIRNNILFILQQ